MAEEKEIKKVSWISYKPQEIEQLIVKLAKQEKDSAKIGLILRDSYGIPSVRDVLGKKIMQVLKEKKLVKDLPEDMVNLINKHILLMKHMKENNHDMVGKRGMQLTESKIKRLISYYQKKGILSADWMYDKTKAKLYVE
ncbi:MAG: 30S ribosomal protein S15 [Nanoarchaeota archaeon]|nr:30S ribosomal protein S15 [Nanoarchaeota archaeon]